MPSARFLGKACAILSATLLLTAAIPIANAQTFANVPALSFTTAASGANPLPQVVAIASTGTQFSFSAGHPVGWGMLHHTRRPHGFRERGLPGRRHL